MYVCIYSVSQKKSPLRFSGIFFPNGWELFINFLHIYYTIISTLETNFYSNIFDKVMRY